MQQLNQCMELRKRINKINEKIIELNSMITSPKNQVISDMPRGGGKKNSIEEYLIKYEKLENLKTKLQNELEEQWQSIDMNGLSEAQYKLLYLRFFCGLEWKKCSRIMCETVGKKFNENRCFREYRSALDILHKTN